MSDGGKGSKPRPYSVNQDTFSDNWNKIFGKKNEEESSKAGEANQPAEPGNLVVSGLQQDA